MDLRQFGQDVLLARKAKRLSQAQLGAKAGVSAMTIRRIETNTGSPDLSTMMAIAGALDLTLATYDNDREIASGGRLHQHPPKGADRMAEHPTPSSAFVREIAAKAEQVETWGEGAKTKFRRAIERVFQEIEDARSATSFHEDVEVPSTAKQ